MRIHRKFDELNNDDLPKEIVINRKKQTHFCYYCPGDISNTQIHRHLRYNNVHNSDSLWVNVYHCHDFPITICHLGIRNGQIFFSLFDV